MKHTTWVILTLLALFFGAQVLGLIIVDHYQLKETFPLGIERPEIEPTTSYIPLFLILLIATGIALVMIKLRLAILWRLWFILSVFLTLLISFAAFTRTETIALVTAGAFAAWRLFRPNAIVHNGTEVFVYGGLAAIFAPLFTIISVSILLVLISAYDYIAVRKTKHMITLAKSQGKAGVFAGFVIPYGKHTAVLGGGDIGFPLIFTAVTNTQLGIGVTNWLGYIIPFCTTLMLFALFALGEKKKYYPAMPYLSLGCFLGLGIVLLLI